MFSILQLVGATGHEGREFPELQLELRELPGVRPRRLRTGWQIDVDPLPGQNKAVDGELAAAVGVCPACDKVTWVQVLDAGRDGWPGHKEGEVTAALVLKGQLEADEWVGRVDGSELVDEVEAAFGRREVVEGFLWIWWFGARHKKSLSSRRTVTNCKTEVQQLLSSWKRPHSCYQINEQHSVGHLKKLPSAVIAVVPGAI